MIGSNLKPAIIYKEKMHRPRLAMNNEKLEKTSNLLLENIGRINSEVNLSLTETASNIQGVLDQQTELINVANKKNNNAMQDIQVEVNKGIEGIYEYLRNINDKLDSLLALPEKLDIVSNQVKDVLVKLAEFDVEPEEPNSNEDTVQNNSATIDDNDEVPKDWISDGESDGD
jgi:predicted translin family RNA/ssDNA-binding protein